MNHTQGSKQDSEAVREYFTREAADYSTLFLERQDGSSFSFRERLKLACQMSGGFSGSLLDCSCGTGEITAAILGSGRFPRAAVVDLSPRMLETARRRVAARLENVTNCNPCFTQSDIFEFASASAAKEYDVILCLGLIAHTGRLEALLGKLAQRLTPNGGILLQSSLLDHPGTRVVRALTKEKYFRRHGYRISDYYHQDIIRLARNAGLKTVETRRFTFGFPFGDRLWAWLNYRLERKMINWSRLHGSEAIYLLRLDSCEP